MIVTVEQVKAQLNVTTDIDDALLARKIAAAQSHIESLLGFAIENRYPPAAGDPLVATVPSALEECVLQLAGHWYENREATLVGVNAQALPLGMTDIVNAFRDYSWGEANGD